MEAVEELLEKHECLQSAQQKAGIRNGKSFAISTNKWMHTQIVVGACYNYRGLPFYAKIKQYNLTALVNKYQTILEGFDTLTN